MTGIKQPPQGHEPMKPKSTSPELRQFHRLLKDAREHLDLAAIYCNDGAYGAAAKYFRKAANVLESASAVRDAALGR